MRISRFSNASLGLLLFSAVLAGGDKDFWSVKSFEEWSAKEAEKLLKNSPWSRTLHMSSSVGGGRGSVVTGAGGRSDSAADTSRGVRGGTTLGAEGDEPVFLSWYARPVREAIARQRMLANPQLTQEDVARILDYDASTHIDFMISGVPARALSGGPAALEELKKDTYLQKRNKERITPSAIIQPGGRSQPVIVRFPRQGDSGDRISLEDKEIEFVMKVASSTLRARFKLADMVVQGKPEL